MRPRAQASNLWRGFISNWGIAIVALLFPAASGAQQYCAPAEATTIFGQWLSPGLMIKTGVTPPFTSRYEPTGVGGSPPAALRFLVELKSATSKRWTLTIRDLDYRVLASIGPRDFEDLSGQPTRRRWTGLIGKGAVIFNLNTDDNGEVDLRIDSALAYPPQAVGALQFSTKKPNDPDWQSLYTNGFETAKQVGNVVGMLVGAVQVGGKKESWCCSGVLLSPTIFLTNWHCGGPSSLEAKSIWRGDVCSNTLIDLGWDDGSLRRQYGCNSVLLRNQPLDFVLLRLTPIAGSGGMAGDSQSARALPNSINEGDDVFMVHHAQCQPKLVSTCHVTNKSYKAWRPSQGKVGETAIGSDTTPDFTHSCDTEPGASGAPIFNAEGKLIGIHHLGFEPTVDKRCDSLNKAVKIGQIFEVIKRDAAHIAQEIGIE